MPRGVISAAVAFPAALFVCLSSLQAPAPPARTGSLHVTLAAGPRGGVYIRVARAIAERAALRGLTVDLVESTGSVDNLRLLSTGAAQIAIAQSDVVHRARRGHRPFPTPIRRLTTLAVLHSEAVQIMVLSRLYVFSIDELKGKTVSLGAKGSGSEDAALAVLEAAGLAPSEINARYLAPDSLLSALDSESIDAGFFTSAVPTPTVAAALRDGEARLLPLTSQVIERLVLGSAYVETAIPKRTYANQLHEIPTVGVRALLIARDDVASGAESSLLDVLVQDRKEIEFRAGVRLAGPDAMSSQDLDYPPATAARPYLGSPWTRSLARLPIAVLVVVLFAGLLFLRRARSARRRIAGALALRGHIIALLLVAGLVWVLGALGLFFFEGQVNENFNSVSKALWSVFVFIGGGFQSRVPITRGGNIIAVMIVVFGVALIGWFTAELASHFLKNELDKALQQVMIFLGRRPVPKGIVDHIVIINWDSRAATMIQQLRAGELQRGTRRPVVVVAERPVELHDTDENRDVATITGSPLNPEILMKARIASAHSVTILSAWVAADRDDRRRVPDVDAADSKTIMTILAIGDACAQADRPCAPITAEIRGLNNINMAKRAGGSAPLEIVCVEELGAEMLTQCAYTPGLATLYADLLTFDTGAAGSNEIYKTTVPNAFGNGTFSQLLGFFLDRRRSSGEAVLPIAVRQDARLYLNPDDEDLTIRPGDELFVIAETQPAPKS